MENAPINNNPLVPVHDVIYKVKPAQIYAVVSFISPAICAIISSLAAKYLNFLPILFLTVIFVLAGIYKYFLVLSRTYYLTGQQFITTKGVFTTSVNYLELYRIKDLFVNQSFIMKMFGLMDVTLIAFDTTEPIVVLKGIPVSNIAQEIRDHVQDCRQKNKILSVDN